jgi:periplasmic divalent cation tolerance protein
MRTGKRDQFLVVYTTTATKAEAEKIARTLLTERLAACANLFPVSSRYWWKGKIEKAGEYGMLLKTRRLLYRKIERRIKSLHSYTVPGIEAWELKAGSRPFLDWIRKETRQGTGA